VVVFEIASPALEALVNAGLVIVLLLFMLVRREDLRNRIIRLSGRRSLTRMTKALDDAAQRISRFLIMQLIINSLFGVTVGVSLALIGVPYPLVWGLMAAVLRYIPYLGTWVAMLLLVAWSVAVFDTWTQPVLVFALFVTIELLTANLLEPLLYGQSIGVSEVALLVAAAFWAWLWGAWGLLLSAPLTACLAVLGRYVPDLEFFHVLLGDEPVLEPHVTYYQRLLARDQEEAQNLVEEFLKEHPPEDLFDRVVLPALVLVKLNRERDQLTQEDEEYILKATQEILDDALQSQRTADAAAVSEEAADTLERIRAEAVGVVGLPARDEADEVALRVFGETLDPTRCRLEVVSSEAVSGEILEQLRKEKPSLICIAALPGDGYAHTRYLCKRLRAQFRDTKILVGCWGLQGDAEHVIARLKAAGADAVGTTLKETRDQLLPLVQVKAAAPENRVFAAAR